MCGKFADIGSGGKGLVASAAEDDHPHPGVGLQVKQQALHVVPHVKRNGVASLRAVYSDGCQGSRRLKQNRR
jgi:hypothetical protein